MLLYRLKKFLQDKKISYKIKDLDIDNKERFSQEELRTIYIMCKNGLPIEHINEILRINNDEAAHKYLKMHSRSQKMEDKLEYDHAVSAAKRRRSKFEFCFLAAPLSLLLLILFGEKKKLVKSFNKKFETVFPDVTEDEVQWFSDLMEAYRVYNEKTASDRKNFPHFHYYDRDALEKSYKKVIKSFHPDNGGTQEEFMAVKKEYEDYKAELAHTEEVQYAFLLKYNELKKYSNGQELWDNRDEYATIFRTKAHILSNSLDSADMEYLRAL